jgi:hypothetical protein
MAVPDRFTHVGEGDDKRLHPVTHALIWATMAVDLGEITSKNIDEWMFRLEALELIGSAIMTRWEGEKPFPHTPARHELQQRIGLRTNVADITRAQFLNKIKAIVKDKANDHVRWAQDKHQFVVINHMLSGWEACEIGDEDKLVIYDNWAEAWDSMLDAAKSSWKLNDLENMEDELAKWAVALYPEDPDYTYTIREDAHV